MKVTSKRVIPVQPDEVTITLGQEEAQQLANVVSHLWNGFSSTSAISLSGCGSVTSTLFYELENLGFKGVR
jgi:hypothetical protein